MASGQTRLSLGTGAFSTSISILLTLAMSITIPLREKMLSQSSPFHLAETHAQLFSQIVEIFSSTCFVCARNGMDLYPFSLGHFTPPQPAAIGIFPRKKVCHLTRVLARNVT